MKRLLLVVFLLSGSFRGIAASAADKVPVNPHRNVTFVSTSDSHFKTSEHKQWNEWDRETLGQITELAKDKSVSGMVKIKPAHNSDGKDSSIKFSQLGTASSP